MRPAAHHRIPRACRHGCTLRRRPAPGGVPKYHPTRREGRTDRLTLDSSPPAQSAPNPPLSARRCRSPAPAATHGTLAKLTGDGPGRWPGTPPSPGRHSSPTHQMRRPAPSDGSAKSPISGHRRRSRRRRASGWCWGLLLEGHIAPSTPSSRVYGSTVLIEPVTRWAAVAPGNSVAAYGSGAWPSDPSPAPVRTRWPRTARMRRRRHALGSAPPEASRYRACGAGENEDPVLPSCARGKHDLAFGYPPWGRVASGPTQRERTARAWRAGAGMQRPTGGRGSPRSPLGTRPGARRPVRRLRRVAAWSDRRG